MNLLVNPLLPMELQTAWNEDNEFADERAASNYGVANGLVCIGKAYVSEKAGSEEVQYTEYTQPAATNYVYQGD